MGPEKDDEFRGVGGSYTVGKDGKRKRVEETTDHPEGNRPRDQKGEATDAEPEGQSALAEPPKAKPWQAQIDAPAPKADNAAGAAEPMKKER